MSEFDKNKMFAMANGDLKALTGMLDSKTFSDEIFGFHAQQAVEKVLKAWINHLGYDHPKIHDIRELFRILRNYGAEVDKFLNLMELNIFAVQFRYDMYYDSEPTLDRNAIINDVKVIIEHVGNLIKDEI
jgi:HEPN domain-containing protein